MNTKIFEIKQKIQALEIEKEKLIQELKRLENFSKDNTNRINSTFNASTSNQLTPIEKIKLFRSIFIGRNDVLQKNGQIRKVNQAILPLKTTMVSI